MVAYEDHNGHAKSRCDRLATPAFVPPSFPRGPAPGLAGSVSVARFITRQVGRGSGMSDSGGAVMLSTRIHWNL